MNITEQIMTALATMPGEYTSREIADKLGLDAKKTSDALGRLWKAGKLVKEDGKFSNPAAAAAPAPEADEALPTPGDKSVDVAAWRRKISAMLRKAERTDNPHEAEAFRNMAEKHMVRLGIHHLELEAEDPKRKEPIVEMRREFKGNYSLALIPFAHYLAQGFGGLQTLQSRRSAMSRTIYVIGPKSHVEEFMLLLDSMVLQAFTALKQWQAETVDERRGLTDMVRAVMHRTFVRNFGIEVMQRLEALRKVEEGNLTPGAALVVASRQDDINAFKLAQYGETKAARGGMQSTSPWAADAGRKAGRKAVLGKEKKVGGTGAKAVTA